MHWSSRSEVPGFNRGYMASSRLRRFGPATHFAPARIRSCELGGRELALLPKS